MFLTLDQIGILCTGGVACWLSQSKHYKARKWSSIFGLAGQPFWFYTSIHNLQWGIFVINFLYTASWIKGVWNYWISPKYKQSNDSQPRTKDLTP